MKNTTNVLLYVTPTFHNMICLPCIKLKKKFYFPAEKQCFQKTTLQCFITLGIINILA